MIRTREDRLEATLTVNGVSPPQGGPFLTRDISQSGFYILSNKGWAPGDMSHFTIRHKNRRLRVMARLARLDRMGSGWTFLDPSPALTSVLSEIMADCFAEGAAFCDRRTQKRWVFQSLSLLRDGWSESLVVVQNLSSTGVFLNGDVRPKPGASVYLQMPQRAILSLEEWPSFALGCTGQVVHHHEGGFGLRFESPSDGFRKTLLNLAASGVETSSPGQPR